MANTRYNHIIWDWNGTLMNDTWLCVEVLNSILQSRQMPSVSRESYRAQFDFPVIEYYERLGFDLVTEPFEDLSVEFNNEYDRRREECLLHEDAWTILESHAQAGRSQSILSASHHERLAEIIEYYELTSFFHHLLGLENVHAEGKIDLGRQCINAIDHDRQEILLIGDTVHDFEVASACGIDCILVSHGHQHHDKLDTCGVPVFESLRAIDI